VDPILISVTADDSLLFDAYEVFAQSGLRLGLEHTRNECGVLAFIFGWTRQRAATLVNHLPQARATE
jgi:hypothetical protein